MLSVGDCFSFSTCHLDLRSDKQLCIFTEVEKSFWFMNCYTRFSLDMCELCVNSMKIILNFTFLWMQSKLWPQILVCFFSRKPSTSNFTRAVYGVCVDPWLDHRLASHHDNNVVIWDTRNFDKPIVTLQQPQTVAKLAWYGIVVLFNDWQTQTIEEF